MAVNLIESCTIESCTIESSTIEDGRRFSDSYLASSGSQPLAACRLNDYTTEGELTPAAQPGPARKGGTVDGMERASTTASVELEVRF